jgi:uracil-DNA glycosylase family 4
MSICKQQTFEELNSRIQKCNKCNLCSLTINQKDLSKGYGKLLGWRGGIKKCRFLFVGMNPSHIRFPNLEFVFGGLTGDKQGVGKRFIDLLKKVEIFEEIYCTNLVKCSSSTNEINLENASNCIGFLLEEFDILKPEVVIALGTQVHDVLLEFFRNYSINAKLQQTWHPNWVFRYKKVSEEKYLDIIKEICEINDKN